MMRIGIGYDVHRLVEGRKCVIGGVTLDYEKGLLGHSDADVLVHAIMDALLGAACLGDIGQLFPDTDMVYRDIDSCELLKRVMTVVEEAGYRVGNVDAVVMAEEPKMAPYREAMKEKLAPILKIHKEQLSIKATTTEGLGFVGRKEGIAAQAVALLVKD